MAVKHVAVFRYVRVMRMLATVFEWLTDFFTGVIIETRKAAISKVAASFHWVHHVCIAYHEYELVLKAFWLLL